MINGNIFDSDADIICHQVNVHGVMGAGIAAQIKDRYPEVYEIYSDFCAMSFYSDEKLLGKTFIVPTKRYSSSNDCHTFIANCFCQRSEPWSDGSLTDYVFMKYSFESVLKQAKSHRLSKIAIPYKMGCGIAGGDWNIVEKIIHDVFDKADIEVEIWKLEV